MKQHAIVLAARRYGFMDEEKGAKVEGVTLTYFDPEAERHVAGEDRLGVDLMTISGDLGNFDRLREVPGLYELAFTQRPGKGGRPTLALAGVHFVEAISLAAEG